MSSATKIVVVKLKELVITGVLALLAVILLVLFIIHITTKSSASKEEAAETTFNPGVYTASILLSGNTMDLEVTVDERSVKSIRLVNTAEAVETMYPLLSSSIKDIELQVKKNNSTDGVTYSSDAKYTSIVLLEAIETALNKARR